MNMAMFHHTHTVLDNIKQCVFLDGVYEMLPVNIKKLHTDKLFMIAFTGGLDYEVYYYYYLFNLFYTVL